jgi:peptidyl-prolyl cis-trans isomerase B (cyclophilin B)
MLKFRAGLILATFLLCACDHHKTTSQTAAGAAPAGRSDAEFTGEQAPVTNSPTYPRALPVTNINASTETASSAAASSPNTNTPSPASEATPPVTVASSPASDGDSSTPPATDQNSTAMPPSAPASNTGTNTIQPVSDNQNPDAGSTSTTKAEYQVIVIDTTLGRIVIQTDDSAAPKTSENFRKLAADGFYNHTIFHRVIPHFIIQGGDPNSLSEDRSLQGKGGPGYTLPPEIKLKHDRGAVAMARLPDSVNPGRESNGSQFYICVVDCPSLDDQYTVFGHVIKGMDVVDAISTQARDNRDNPLNRVEMEVTLQSKEQALMQGSAASP